MTDLSIADVLERAADLIEPEGKWTQGTYACTKDLLRVDPFDDDAHCFCTLGAIEAVTKRHWSETGAYHSILQAIGIEDTGNCLNVIHIIGGWNDAPERTQSEVVAKLRQAAVLAREQGK